MEESDGKEIVICVSLPTSLYIIYVIGFDFSAVKRRKEALRGVI